MTIPKIEIKDLIVAKKRENLLLDKMLFPNQLNYYNPNNRSPKSVFINITFQDIQSGAKTNGTLILSSFPLFSTSPLYPLLISAATRKH